MLTRFLTYGVFLLTTGLLKAQTFEYRTYYDEGRTELKEIITLTEADSTVHGPYISYYQNGAPLAKGNYSSNLPSGMWIYFFESGKEKASGPLVRGEQTGEWQYFYENGNLKSKGPLTNGVKNGIWTNYFENGTRKSVGEFVENTKNGMWNYFFEDGTSKAQAFFENGEGNYKEFFPSGKLKMEGYNRNEVSQGQWKYYYESGELRGIGNFIDGKREGRWVYYHANGQKSSEGNYLNGLRSGNWNYYHENGNVSSQGSMKDDQRNGSWNLYYENGIIKSEGQYENGSGVITEYYPSGTILAKGAVINGKKSGLWEFFDESGNKDGEAIYQDGLGEYKGFYDDGIIKMTGQLEGTKRVGEWSLLDREGNIVGKYKPIYEEDRPIYRIHDVVDEDFVRYSVEKPDYRYKNRSIRYFDAVINEFTGLIFATNPVWMTLGELPFSIEYYIQERLGYEVQYIYLRDPFSENLFSEEPRTQLEDIYQRGHMIRFRQKFYSRDTEYGMIHFGHNLSFSQSNYYTDYSNQDTGFEVVTANAKETTAAYGLFVGWRWMRTASGGGFTIDSFVGIDIGFRSWEKQYENSDFVDGLFMELDQSEFYLPIVVGINLGWLSSTRKLFNK